MIMTIKAIIANGLGLLAALLSLAVAQEEPDVTECEVEDGCWKRVARLVILVGAITCGASQAAGFTPRVERDIAYLGTNRTEKADLYLPESATDGQRCPGIIVIHGGGWGSGDKTDKRERTICMALASHGFAALSINYRLAEAKSLLQEVWPRNIQDCKIAVRWLRQNAGQYGIDGNRIGVMGCSAGGHLAALLGTTGPDSGLEPKEPMGDVSCRVGAVVDFFGPIQLGSAPLKPGSVPETSPVKYVCKDTPPFLLVHGTADKGISIECSRQLAAALKNAGVEHELIEVEGAGHGFGLVPSKDKDLCPAVVK